MSLPDFVSTAKDHRGVFSTLNLKPACRAATAAALAAYTRVGNVITANANGAMAAVDTSVTLAVGDRLLLKDGAADADNGIYEVTSLGGASAPFVLTRAEDQDISAQCKAGCLVPVVEGTANATTVFMLTGDADPIVLNTTALTYTAI